MLSYKQDSFEVFTLCKRKKNAYKKICIDQCGVCIKVNNTEKWQKNRNKNADNCFLDYVSRQFLQIRGYKWGIGPRSVNNENGLLPAELYGEWYVEKREWTSSLECTVWTMMTDEGTRKQSHLCVVVHCLQPRGCKIKSTKIPSTKFWNKCTVYLNLWFKFMNKMLHVHVLLLQKM